MRTAEAQSFREEALFLFSCRTPEGIFQEGGSRDWVLSPDRAEKCRYVVITRNTGERPEPYQGQPHVEPHGSAFMLGLISGTVDWGLDPKTGKHRYLVAMSHYHLLTPPVPEVWPAGRRNPVAYISMPEARDRLRGLDFEALDWTPMVMPAAAGSAVVPSALAATIAEGARLGIGYGEMDTLLRGFIAGRAGRVGNGGPRA